MFGHIFKSRQPKLHFIQETTIVAKICLKFCLDMYRYCQLMPMWWQSNFRIRCAYFDDLQSYVMDQYCKLFAICAGLQVHCTLCTICNDIVSAFEEWWLETIIDCTPVDRQSTPRKIHLRGKSTIARQQIKRQSWKNVKSKIAQNDTRN